MMNFRRFPTNVVFILSDDHRYDAMSFLGHQLAETPHMDAMAATGVHLTSIPMTPTKLYELMHAQKAR